jgi:hypothetical protein
VVIAPLGASLDTFGDSFYGRVHGKKQQRHDQAEEIDPPSERVIENSAPPDACQ